MAGHVRRHKQMLLLRRIFGKCTERKKLGISGLLMVTIVIIIVLVAGIGVYFAYTNGFNSAGSHSGQSKASSTVTTDTTSSLHAVSTSTRGSSSGLSGVSTYSGEFNFSLSLGPAGERLASNNTVETYGSVEAGSGSFTFSIAATNESGTGSGQGTLTVTTTGFCSGTTTIPYTFEIPDATTLLGNLTVFIGNPTPSTYLVPLTCTGSLNGVDTTTNNPGSFIAVYPNEISAASFPASVTQHLSGGINYSYTIVQTS